MKRIVTLLLFVLGMVTVSLSNPLVSLDSGKTSFVDQDTSYFDMQTEVSDVEYLPDIKRGSEVVILNKDKSNSITAEYIEDHYNKVFAFRINKKWVQKQGKNI